MARGSIVRRGESYIAVYRLPSGRQVWKSGGKGAKGRKAAERILAEALGQIAKDGQAYREPKDAKFSEFVERFFTDNAYRYRESTLTIYRSLSKPLLDYFGAVKMRRGVNVENLTAYVRDALARGVSPAQVNRTLNVASAICEWAVKVDILPTNPVRSVRRPEEARSHERVVLSPAQIQRVIQFTPTGWQRNLVTIAAHCALRAGELAALGVTSVDFSARELVVDKTIWRSKVMPNTKTGQVRRVPLSTAAMEAVQSQMNLRVPNGHDLLFTGARGGVLNMSRVGADVLAPALKRAGVVVPRGQDGWMLLRHSAISAWVASGKVDPATIAAIAGHVTVATTYKHYIHPHEDNRHEAADVMDGLMDAAAGVAKTAVVSSSSWTT